ncbi:MAG: MBL fold metallo-hydrolase [Streptosporangiales bacterium]|nr:MBL fold metallo-hydrolase [Streptosporangiales bacterium]
MRLTKLGHSCIRLEADGRTLVIDPGTFSEDTAADGADAVLITHEHPDHADPEKLRGLLGARDDVTVWTNPALAETLSRDFPGRVRAVSAGERFEAAGFDVHVHGSEHALIRDGVPIVSNVGFLIDGLFHPGDAFTVPDEPVETLLLPVNAPWAKLNETLTQLSEIKPRRVHPIHDALLTDYGWAVYGGHTQQVSGDVGTDYERLKPGDTIDL